MGRSRLLSKSARVRTAFNEGKSEMRKIRPATATIAAVVFVTCSVLTASAQDEAELAKKLQNPIANLISVPMQSNWDFGIGPADAMRYTLNIQPVIPFSLNSNWNLITRTIMPIVHAESPLKADRIRPAWGTSCKAFSSRLPSRLVGGL